MNKTKGFDVSMNALATVRTFVDSETDLARLNQRQSALLVVAVVEVATNIIRHAKGIPEGGQFQITSTIHIGGANSFISLAICYPGEPFTPKPPDESIDFSHYPEGGFGNFIIHNACDKVAFEYEKGMNCIVLTVNAKPN